MFLSSLLVSLLSFVPSDPQTLYGLQVRQQSFVTAINHTESIDNSINGVVTLTGGSNMQLNQLYRNSTDLYTLYSVEYNSYRLFDFDFYYNSSVGNFGVNVHFDNTFDNFNLTGQFFFECYYDSNSYYSEQTSVYDFCYLYQNHPTLTIDIDPSVDSEFASVYDIDYYNYYYFSFNLNLLNQSTFDTLMGSTYNQGYQLGYENGKVDGVNDFKSSTEYQEILDDQFDTGWATGHNVGYNEGINTQTYTFAQFFGAIADTPILILRNLLGFDVFGVNAMAILMSMLTGAIVLYLIKKIIL